MQHTDTRMKDLLMNGNNVIPLSKTRHAPMPIYRPPNLRDGTSMAGERARLNVHAKEFVMNNGSPKYSGTTKQGFFSNDNIKNGCIKWKDPLSKIDKPFPLNLSKSNGNIALGHSKPDSSHFSQKQMSNGISVGYNLQRTKSIGDVLSNNVGFGNSTKVQFKTPLFDRNNNRSGLISPSKDKKNNTGANYPVLGALKRSKSLGAADALKLMEVEASFPNYSPKFTEYHLFPTKMHDSISQAIQNVNKMTDKNRIVLARGIVEQATKDKKCSLPAAKLCAIIMEKEKSGAFSDSFLNTCQMLYEKRESSFSVGDAKFISFLSFLTEMFSELKRIKLQIKLNSDPIIPPKITLLIIISRCCEDILVQKQTHSLQEIECLFLTLTSLGRDIECELPAMFKKLFSIIKTVFLKGSNGQQIQKIFLQMMELRAANWQLPVSALNYYYPKSSN
ncbi:hypothetical protein V9T40_002473 [Parthenolecanium corni]|uniref:MIF4G domain-containing protein n=1 Tax=Parthenolecanium corni TaxID=536013 RepID=A0AAN9TIY5_9HEMI